MILNMWTDQKYPICVGTTWHDGIKADWMCLWQTAISVEWERPSTSFMTLCQCQKLGCHLSLSLRTNRLYTAPSVCVPVTLSRSDPERLPPWSFLTACHSNSACQPQMWEISKSVSSGCTCTHHFHTSICCHGAKIVHTIQQWHFEYCARRSVTLE